MTITKQREGTKLTLALEGRLDTITSPELADVLDAELNGVTELLIDMERLVYLSSAGLRVILTAQKRMNRQGKMTVAHVCADIMEVFEITGFVDILDIQN
ncbi:MAG: STAS domain-containing protein [Clostridiales bacterium]|nr:STAS domain-containing protein [Clostridiales bacterium]MCD7886164.1 STAS domain-containing protein [Clostridiales bacterium]MCD8335287.1 STAS domain-containing protein [Clostridiales bacterium]